MAAVIRTAHEHHAAVRRVRMARNRVSLLDRDEALEICAKIKAKHPDILERGPEGLYRYLVGGEDLRQALFDYLACDRVAAAWAS